jgi:acyl dehydratase
MSGRRKFEELELDEVFESSGLTITETHVVLFAGLTGDFHPVHTDETVASQSPYGGRIAHGPAVFAIATGLFTIADPIDSIAFLGMTWKYLRPVPIGDTIRVRSTLLNKRITSSGDKAIVHHSREVLNQRDEVVQEGETDIMMLLSASASDER